MICRPAVLYFLIVLVLFHLINPTLYKIHFVCLIVKLLAKAKVLIPYNLRAYHNFFWSQMKDMAKIRLFTPVQWYITNFVLKLICSLFYLLICLSLWLQLSQVFGVIKTWPIHLTIPFIFSIIWPSDLTFLSLTFLGFVEVT